MMPTAKRSLQVDRLPIWRSVDRSFALYWASTAASDFGSMVSLFAVPMTAIQLLEATPTQIGYLRTAEILPSALFGILAGVLADSCSRKRMMIIRDLGAGVSLLFVGTGLHGGPARHEPAAGNAFPLRLFPGAG